MTSASGQTVVHPEYGLGRIVAVEGEGSGRKGRVAFAVGPPRTFVLANLRCDPSARPHRRPARREPKAISSPLTVTTLAH